MANLTIGTEQNTHKAIRPVDQPYEAKISQTLASGNGTTGFGTVEAGTVLGKITSSGKLRPCPKALVSSGASSSTGVTVGAAASKPFFVGDSLTITRPTGTKGTATLTVSGAGTPDLIDIESATADGLAHTVALVDPSANDQELFTTVTVNPSTGVATIVVSHSTGGAGAITTTVAQVLAQLQSAAVRQYIVATEGDDYSGSNTAIAVASTPLAGGVAAGGTVSSSNAITAVNKSTGVITVTSAVTTVAGDIVRTADGSQTAVGILDKATSTLDNQQTQATGTETHRDQSIAYSCSGFYTEAQLVGLNAQTLADLGGTDLGDIIRL